jgi:hypothetical protein
VRTVGATAAFWVGTLILIALPPSALSQGNTAAIVVEIRGEVFVKTATNRTPIRLDPKIDVGRPLLEGDKVRCSRGGVVRILRDVGSREIRSSSEWYTLRRGLSQQSRYIQQLLDNYGRLGGRERAEQSQLFSPSPHSVVMPEQFVIGWNRGPAIRTIALIIQEPGGREIWRQDSVDGASGKLTSDAARRALATYRAGGSEGPLFLKLIDSDGNDAEVTFSVISELSEQSLRRDLALWARDTVPFVSHLGRAAVFARAGMFVPAAEEYEAALLAAPESRDLLISAILAHRRAGNVDRAAELTKRLPEGTTVP